MRVDRHIQCVFQWLNNKAVRDFSIPTLLVYAYTFFVLMAIFTSEHGLAGSPLILH